MIQRSVRKLIEHPAYTFDFINNSSSARFIISTGISSIPGTFFVRYTIACLTYSINIGGSAASLGSSTVICATLLNSYVWHSIFSMFWRFLHCRFLTALYSSLIAHICEEFYFYSSLVLFHSAYRCSSVHIEDK